MRQRPSPFLTVPGPAATFGGAAVACAAMAWAAIVCAASGCVVTPYPYGAADSYLTSYKLEERDEPQFERGKPRPVIDGIGWVVGIPAKIILWNRRVDNHAVSPETENVLAEYLALNELQTVKVRVNQYAPLQEWDRLTANQSVGWGWRYTAGALTWLEYTLLPGRIFGGDNYNPFTNTINLYSDLPAIAVHEGGHSKDFAGRYWKGTYAVAYALPGAPLWHEGIATTDALSYFRNERPLEEEQEAYRVLYPAYGTYVGGAASHFVSWNSNLVFAGAVIPGHLLGRMQARRAADYRSLRPEQNPRRLPPDDVDQWFAPHDAEPGTSKLPVGDPWSAEPRDVEPPAAEPGAELPEPRNDESPGDEQPAS